jgi:tRNA1Val (adenine37-N6)-methyltransferase
MSLFRFKQFTVKQADSAMKVGTDSVLLGCLLEASVPGFILDIGTGTGLLALMMAQRFSEAKVDAVEIDPIAFEEAQYNVNESKWKKQINLYNQSFQDFCSGAKQYDLIVSNPPYYETENHFFIPAEQRSKARHTAELSFDDLILGVHQLLSETGLCWMVLPAKEYETITQKAAALGLSVCQRISIYPKVGKACNRIIFGVSKIPQPAVERDFFIYEAAGGYTHEYYVRTEPFLLWNNLR